MKIKFEDNVTGVLPARQEREMWLIAQEAILNVERHAMASGLHVQWASNGQSARLLVSDDGRGFASVAGRLDSYGLRGLKERAGAIGAHMEITSAPDKGTTIICRLD
jgi:signal transduction histidine kinase